MTTEVPHARRGEEQYGRYRAVSTSAVASLVCGVLSISTVFNWFLALIPAAGIVLGRFALGRIRATPEELTGRGLALWGLGLSVGFWVLGYGWLTLKRVSEVPPGYEQVHYEDLQPGPGERIPPKAYELQQKEKGVFIKGYMQAGRQQARLKTFILCPSIAGCPFCTPKPKPTEMIRVELEGDLEADYTVHEVGVAGRLRVDPGAPDGVPYRLDANYLKSPP